MKLEIKELSLENIDRICEIESESFSMPWKKDDFLGLIRDNNSEYIVVYCDGIPVGTAGYTFNGFEGYINNVVIDKSFRGRGISKVLMEELLKSGRGKNINEFTLEVRVSNIPAVKLYESLGFKSEGIRKNFYERPTEDANVMWLRY